FGVLHLDGFGSTLNQADDVTHAEDAPGNPVWMEGLQIVERFADAGELNRLAGDRAHAERGTTAGIAIHAGENHTGEIDLAGEAFRNVHCVLAGEAVDDEQG